MDRRRSNMPAILFADKDARYASVLRRWFEPNGVSCSYLSDGTKIASLAREIRPSAIICSLRIDCVDGFDAVKRVREDADLESVPCIVFTDLADKMDVRRCRMLGCVAYFIKRHTKPEYLFAYLKHSGYLV